ncbi:MAG: CDGSH iron-sulfur domain-containing protein [Actinomycetota bacterium]|nr:CDGSH iron-sulfur domain-containing protein [Actinomycetota bacterium]
MTDGSNPSITVAANGPYLVAGNLALHRRREVESELGEPMTWATTSTLETKDRYALCRCGQSSNKPFCDGTHARIGFEADDVAAGTYAERADLVGGDVNVRYDQNICVHAGFCGTTVTNVWDEAAKIGDTAARMHAIAMIEHCPSGALTYQLGGVDNEPLLPQAVAVVNDGPLWVTGRVPVTSSDGTTLEARNRVTLCRCGVSANKPLCDGSHKAAGFTEP